MEALALLLVIIMWFLLNRKIKELSERVALLEGENDQVVKQIKYTFTRNGYRRRWKIHLNTVRLQRTGYLQNRFRMLGAGKAPQT